jgi:Rieske 2Fe-2S family protein
MAVRYRDTRPPLPAGTFTLPARFYTDPAHFRRELETIHYRAWLCAGRTEELPEAGSYFLRQVGEAGVVVLRDESGELAAFHNVCRHRGTLLLSEEAGRLQGRIRCGYHGWTYGLDGRLLGAPHMEKVEGFCEEDYPLLKIHTAVWDGHLFLNLAENPLPFTEHLAGLERKFRPWRMEELRRVERRVYQVKANWKLIVQNYSECLHCPLAHPLFSKHSHYLSGDNEPPGPSYLGGRMELKEGVKTLTVDGQTGRSCFVDLDAADRRRVYYYALLPNFLLTLHPDYVLTTVLWPRAVDRTEIVCEWHFHPDEIRKPDFDARGAIELWDVTNRQDWELSDLAQAGISSPGYRPGPYSNREELLHHFDRWVLERVGRAD